MLKTVEMDFQFQPYIPGPPRPVHELHAQACSNDSITIESWRNTWIEQTRENHKTHGPFSRSGIGKLFGRNAGEPAVILGAGPSLKENWPALKKRGRIVTISCLHNFHFLEDNGVPADFYVSLDAGPVTISEISEGGKRKHEEYLEISKDRTLLAFIGSHPDLIKSWKGKIYWFNSPIPDQTIHKEINAIEKFNTHVATGGNVLGACLYIAKGIFGCNPIIFAGADFSFSYKKKFHAWDSKYDANIGHAMRAVDVWGNSVTTWQSYFNFKCWFDHVAVKVPGIYINATEGGIFGAYPEGNIGQVTQMTLDHALLQYQIYEELRDQCENPNTEDLKLLF